MNKSFTQILPDERPEININIKIPSIEFTSTKNLFSISTYEIYEGNKISVQTSLAATRNSTTIMLFKIRRSGFYAFLLLPFLALSLAVKTAFCFVTLEVRTHQIQDERRMVRSDCCVRTDSDDYDDSTKTHDARRRLLVGMSLSPLLFPVLLAPVQASEVRAPLELLRPATRVQLFIDEAINHPISNDDAGLERLREFLDNPPAFMTTEEEKLSKLYMEIDTSTTWQQARRMDREARGKEAGIDYGTPYDQVNSAIQQWGDRRQFQILRKRERGREEVNPVRAAFNAYTNNLVFGDSYRLNAAADLRKSLIRNNALPDVNAVVVSDLDLRDLYRNQVLERLDDARAEIDYQQRTGELDTAEVMNSLKAAQDSCREWFRFIPDDDVATALKAVQEERLRTNLLGNSK